MRLRVSILIVLELPLWPAHRGGCGQGLQVSILIVLELPLWQLKKKQLKKLKNEVSILIVLELPLWPFKIIWTECLVGLFQSLLFWNYRCGYRRELIHITPEGQFQSLLFWNYRCGKIFGIALKSSFYSFNPYCSGITAVALRLYNPPTPEGRFNPYCSGITAVAGASIWWMDWCS